MKILLIEPRKPPRPLDIKDDLTAMQRLVGGTIQALYPFDERVALICNDDGKLLGLPPNRALCRPNGEIYDVLVGPFFLCATPPDSDSFESLSDEQIARFSQLFRTPKTFAQIGNTLFCVPENESKEEKHHD